MTTNGKNLSRQSSGPTSSSVQKLCTDTTELLGSNNMVSEDGKNVYSCGNGQSTTNSQFLKKILFDTYMEYEEFEQLFKSFYIHMRKDLKEIFDRYAILVNSKNTNDQNVDKTWQSTRKLWKGLIYENYHQLQQKKSTLSNSCTESKFTKNLKSAKMIFKSILYKTIQSLTYKLQTLRQKQPLSTQIRT